MHEFGAPAASQWHNRVLVGNLYTYLGAEDRCRPRKMGYLDSDVVPGADPEVRGEMPRRSADDKEKTHRQILHHAAKEFRARGSAVGIADVMKDLGLTKGGFYRHFDSKDDLFVEAVSLSFKEVGDKLEQVAEASPENSAAAIIKAYLSTEHLRHPETWCALASLAPEIGRMPAKVRKRLDGASILYMERLSKFMHGADAEERRKNFLLLFSGMAGAIAVIRTLSDLEMRDQILAMTREHYLKMFA